MVADELWKLFMVMYELKLTPRGKVLLEKPVVSQLFSKFSVFFGN
jgi:hypothetical protein